MTRVSSWHHGNVHPRGPCLRCSGFVAFRRRCAARRPLPYRSQQETPMSANERPGHHSPGAAAYAPRPDRGAARRHRARRLCRRRCQLCRGARLSRGRAPATIPVAATTQATLAPDQSGAIQPQPSNTLLPDFSNLVTQVRPAVVSVTNHLKQSQDQAQASRLVACRSRSARCPTTINARGRSARLGLHHRPLGHHRHQQPRGAQRALASR